MTDPRNVAHDKKVQQEKKHRGEEISPGAQHAVQPGRKPHMEPKVEMPASDEDGSGQTGGDAPGSDKASS